MTHNNNIYIVLDNVKYAQNIGPIFRVADAFGVKKLFLCRSNLHRLNPCQERILHKASRGATKWIEWEFRTSCNELIRELKDNGINIIGVETGNKSKFISEIKPSFPLALVFGSEDDGISNDVLELTDYLIKIPMTGQGRSLNISSSVSIATYEIFKYLS